VNNGLLAVKDDAYCETLSKIRLAALNHSYEVTINEALKKGVENFMSANDLQIGGKHYQSSIQHWDYVVANDLDYFQAQITKYVTRWKKKNGIQDLEKALHFLEKYLELNFPNRQLRIDKELAEKQTETFQELNEMARGTGVPDHLKEFVPTERQKEVAAKFEDLRLKQEEALSPMLHKFLKDSGEPLPQGYVNQDLPYTSGPHTTDRN